MNLQFRVPSVDKRQCYAKLTSRAMQNNTIEFDVTIDWPNDVQFVAEGDNIDAERTLNFTVLLHFDAVLELTSSLLNAMPIAAVKYFRQSGSHYAKTLLEVLDMLGIANTKPSYRGDD